MIWVTNNGEPGGADGMTPFLTFYTVGIQSSIGILVWVVLRHKIKKRQLRIIALLIYGVLYEIIFAIIAEQSAIMRIFESGFGGELSRAYSFSSIGGILIAMTFMIFKEKEKI